jgi:hypothetical protein
VGGGGEVIRSNGVLHGCVCYVHEYVYVFVFVLVYVYVSM